ncbi:hypothetical protein Droror1_Dr00005872 [Drosera rotundifolia]
MRNAYSTDNQGIPRFQPMKIQPVPDPKRQNLGRSCRDFRGLVRFEGDGCRSRRNNGGGFDARLGIEPVRLEKWGGREAGLGGFGGGEWSGWQVERAVAIANFGAGVGLELDGLAGRWRSSKPSDSISNSTC